MPRKATNALNAMKAPKAMKSMRVMKAMKAMRGMKAMKAMRGMKAMKAMRKKPAAMSRGRELLPWVWSEPCLCQGSTHNLDGWQVAMKTRLRGQADLCCHGPLEENFIYRVKFQLFKWKKDDDLTHYPDGILRSAVRIGHADTLRNDPDYVELLKGSHGEAF